jgi:hypothetical protein
MTLLIILSPPFPSHSHTSRPKYGMLLAPYSGTSSVCDFPARRETKFHSIFIITIISIIIIIIIIIIHNVCYIK